ncbi:MAG: oligosaccharide flippase family protein [Bacteroidota bacterium]|nr:oligosaccharide flippase family protein [Bacteroidota bacterium]
MNIGRKAIVSTLWTSGLNYIAMAVGFVFGIFRDRILMPDENGVYMFGLAVVDTLFILAAVSFNISVIQADEKREDLYSTAFVLTLILAALMLLATGIVAWVLTFFEITTLMIQAFLVLAAFSTLNLFTILFSSYLEKQLEYKKIARINLLSVLAFPLVSYALVVNGWGAWGMVLGYSSTFVVSFIGMSVISHYPVGLRWNPATVRWFLSMGWKLIFSRGMEVIFVRYGTLVTQHLLGTNLQGSYGRALKYWEMAPQTVAPAVVTVALPTYAKVQHDGERLSRAFSLVLYFLVRVLMPFVLVFGVLPESFIRIIGEQWLDAVPVLRILAAGALLSPMFENMKQLLYAKGKPEAIVRVRIGQLVIFLPAMYVLVLWMGISGAALAIVINYMIGVFGALFIVRREVSVRWLHVFVLPVIFAALATGIFLAFPPGQLGMGAIVQFLLEALYLVGIFAVLELIVEQKQLRTHAAYIRTVMKGGDRPEHT